MALPDFIKYEVGASKTWKASGGDYAITLTSLANNSGRQGAKGDLGVNRARLWEVFFTSSVAVTAVAGKEIELFWASSSSATAGTDNSGGTDGTDSALGTTTTVHEYKYQLIFIGSLILTNAATTGIQKQRFIFSPPCRYGMPVVVNMSGQALGATSADHQIVFTPLEEVIEDTV